MAIHNTTVNSQITLKSFNIDHMWLFSFTMSWQHIYHASFLKRFKATCFTFLYSVLWTYRITLECFSKWGKDLFSNPSGTRDPLIACWPTQAIIWDILMKDPGKKKNNLTHKWGTSVLFWWPVFTPMKTFVIHKKCI